jgi:hypothetical protein
VITQLFKWFLLELRLDLCQNTEIEFLYMFLQGRINWSCIYEYLNIKCIFRNINIIMCVAFS